MMVRVDREEAQHVGEVEMSEYRMVDGRSVAVRSRGEIRFETVCSRFEAGEKDTGGRR